MIDLSGRVAVVTGAASGIGAASAATLAAQGAKVVLADINVDGATEQAEKIAAGGGTALAVETDVRVEEQVARVLARAVEVYGRLDVLHNNAAAMDLAGVDPGITELDLKVWEGTLATNARGPLLGCKHAVPLMLRSGGGSIINTSSISSQVGELTMTAYGAAKAALSQITRAVAAQWGKQGIRCNAVAPGLVLSPSGLGLPREIIDLYIRHSLTPYVGEPQDIANLVAFLASDDARYITAQTINIDGGLVAHNPIQVELVELAQAQQA
ncbi:SDR family oxidoreductase [Frankia sp. AiPs1]|uniref:SDR family NAD(P)-dependent oxidoreductase n=1 Tax=Frankia sp. AiPs1 TaxID=573493 RepID=UPI002043CE74|nr:SDR family oxidoreductase [Frankia sp. AiPs1]MCM3920499.1 SDR family oxidoreductase [Frankia sp. AiPs1]